MGKINGQFAPLTQELGDDPRFISDLTDLQKLMLMLIIYTCHMTRHKAPINPNYYKKRFNIKAPNSAIVKAIERIIELYPKFRVSLESGKDAVRLSLDASKDAVRSELERSKVFISMENSKTYKIGKRLEVEEEQEEEREQEDVSSDRLSDWKKIEAAYPNKASITKAMQTFFASPNLKPEVVLKAIEKYKTHLAANAWKKPMNLDRFLTEIDAWINHVEPDKPKEVIRKPEGRSYDRDNDEFNKKLQEWKKEQATA